MILDTPAPIHSQETETEASTTSPTSLDPTSPPLGPPSEVSLSELEAASVGSASEIQDGVSVDSLREAALSIPDVEAETQINSVVPHSHSQSNPIYSSQVSTSDSSLQNQGILSSSSSGSSTPIDWPALLGVSSQTLDAASTATSFGFAAARTATSFGLTFAKRLTQVLVAVPAMAVDGALLGVAPGGIGSNSNDRQPTAAAIAHATVGGLFDGIAMLALGGIDVGSALTGAGLGAAGAGVEGVRRALGSEVLRSLSAFSKLVKREWLASDLSTLPPGGIPNYSSLAVTRALTCWVLIQLVTRADYERRQLRGMEEINVMKMKKACREELERRKKTQEERQDSDSSGKGANVKITSETTLPDEEGELIGATIGSSHSNASIAETPVDSPNSKPPTPLDTQEALLGLRRYSRLVLGVYGGVALAWLGALPTEESDSSDPLAAAASESTSRNPIVVDAEAPRVQPKSAQALNSETSSTSPETSEEIKNSREEDEAEFIQGASELQIQTDSHHTLGIAAGGSGLFDDGSAMPGAFGSTFTTEPEISAAPGTPSTSSNPPPTTTSASSNTTTGSIPPQRSGTAYSYLDLISGKHDDDLFHKTGGLRKGAAMEGSYDEYVPAPVDSNATARTSKPRYYVVTDHEAEKICLILRGSLSVGDIAADLTCESVRWQHAGEESASREKSRGWENQNITKLHASNVKSEGEGEENEKDEIDLVHEGMYLTAQEIGLPGRPVHRAVLRALTLNPTYSLDIAGHSLGAGVASLLALMWGSTDTGKTHSRSGLPINRELHAYCFAVPCVTSQSLSKRSKNLITSFIVNFDLVCRLSLGSVLDVRNACAWLCYEDSQSRLNSQSNPIINNDSNQPTSSMAPPPPFTLNRFTQKAFKHQASQLNQEDQETFEIETLSLRKTLEANMNQVELFPPGNLFVSFAKNNFKTQTKVSEEIENQNEKFRLFKIKENANLGDVFDQIQFVSGMLSDHMPQVYNDFVNDLSS